VTLYLLAAVCPSCGRRPRVRLHAAGLRRHDDLEPDEPVQTYQCHVTGCRTIYPLAALAFQRAERVPGAEGLSA
jgi:hypothetical protein